MTEKLFYEDSSLEEITTKLIKIIEEKDQYGLIFKRTIFYPEGGGQPADKGTINGIEVIDVQEINSEVIHYIKKETNIIDIFKTNEIYHLKINTSVRKDHSIQHSAQHLLSAILYDEYNSQTLSFHLGKTFSTIDVEKKFTPDEIPEIENKIQSAIASNHAFMTHYFEDILFMPELKLRKQPKVDKNIRIVEIIGYDASPCGGTHVSSTLELQLFKIIKIENYKGNYRLYFLAGNRAIKDYQQKHDLMYGLGNTLSCSPENIPQQITSTIKESAYKSQKINRLESALAKRIYIDVKKEQSTFLKIIFEDNYQDFDFVMQFQKIIKKDDFSAGIIASKKDKKVFMFSFTEQLHCGNIFKDNIKTFAGKGGGNAQKAQGIFASEEEMTSFMESIFLLSKSLIK